MRRWHHAVVPFATFTIYVSLMFLFGALIADQVVVMLLTHAVMILICIGHNRLTVPLLHRDLKWPAVVGIVFGVCLFWLMTSITATMIVNMSEPTVSMPYAYPALFGLLSLIVAPVSEELIFRSVIFKHLRQGFPAIAAYLISASVFAIIHTTVQQAYIGFFCGILFACVYDYTGKILSSILVHMGYNALTLGLSGIIHLPASVFSMSFVLPCNVILVIALFGLVGYVTVVDSGKDEHIQTGKIYLKEKDGVQGKIEAWKSSLLTRFTPRVSSLCRQYEPDILLLLTTQHGACVFSGPVSKLRGNEYADVRSRRIVANSGKVYVTENKRQETVFYICYLIQN